MTDCEERPVSRRSVLRSAALAGGVAGGASAVTGRAAAESRPVFPEYVRDARDGTYADLRGESSVAVEVGAGESTFAFVPAFVWVDPGTTVTFELVSDNHNVVPWSRPAGEDWRGTGSTIHNAGYTHAHTFETPGMYTYYCQPHDQLDMKGAVAVGSDVPTTEEGFGDDPETVLGVPLPSTPIQWGVAAVATVGATALATAGTWLWWHSTGVDVDDYDLSGSMPVDGVARANDTESTPLDRGERAADASEALTDGTERLDRHLQTAVERRERAEAALADGEYEAAREALDRAATALDRAADVEAEHDLDAGERVAAECEVVTALRERCDG